MFHQLKNARLAFYLGLSMGRDLFVLAMAQQEVMPSQDRKSKRVDVTQNSVNLERRAQNRS
jgi:hypothetical protein